MRHASTFALLGLQLATGCQEYDIKSQVEPEKPAPEQEPPTAELELPDEVTPDFLDFGILPKQCFSNVQEVRVENVGGADLDVSQIEIVGSDHSNFQVRGANPQVLAPGAYFTFEIGFSPEVASSLGVNGVVSSNDPRLHHGLEASKTALTAPLSNDQNAHAGEDLDNDGVVDSPVRTNHNFEFARPGSVLSVIAISDEDDSSSMSAQSYANWLNNQQGGDPLLTSFSAITGPPSGILPCISFATGTSASPSYKYGKAIQATGGRHADICKLDFSTVLTMLSAVAAGLQTEFPLSFDALPATISVEVDGQSIPQNNNNGWSYDAQTNTVTFNGNSVPPPGAFVDIAYETANGCN